MKASTPFRSVVVLLFLVLSFSAHATKLDFAEAAVMVKDYYNNEGEWAGIYTMSNIERMALNESKDDYGYVAHVCYHYRPIPNNRIGRNDSGVDQRTFSFGMVHGGYRVLSMGGHMSTNVGCR
ncbi:exported hypothetical protein [Gammaproteobacteria bacterium]